MIQTNFGLQYLCVLKQVINAKSFKLFYCNFYVSYPTLSTRKTSKNFKNKQFK